MSVRAQDRAADRPGWQGFADAAMAAAVGPTDPAIGLAKRAQAARALILPSPDPGDAATCMSLIWCAQAYATFADAQRRIRLAPALVCLASLVRAMLDAGGGGQARTPYWADGD